VPLAAMAVWDEVNASVEPEGASNGTFWQAAARTERPAAVSNSVRLCVRAIMKAVNILKPMRLERQARSVSEKREHAPRNTVGAESGYAMAALLVAMAVMAVMMTVAIPVWKQAVQREKEEELVFRGQQYVHAITLFSRKYSNAFPPNVNVLVEQRFLRKKYKDPITNDDFEPIPVGQQGTPGISGPLGPRARAANDKAQPPAVDLLRRRTRPRAGNASRNPFIGGVSPFEPQQPPPSPGRSGR
jgi:type II secretory pathway pseudopilin PulG